MEQRKKSFKELKKECHINCLKLEVERGASDDKRHELYRKEELTPEEEQWEISARNYEYEVTRLFNELKNPIYSNPKYRDELEDKLLEIDLLLKTSSMKSKLLSSQ